MKTRPLTVEGKEGMKKVSVIAVGVLILLTTAYGEQSGFLPESWLDGTLAKELAALEPKIDYTSLKVVHQENIIATTLERAVAGQLRPDDYPVKGLDDIIGATLLRITFLHEEKPSKENSKGLDDHVVLLTVKTSGRTLVGRRHTTYKAHLWIVKDGEYHAIRGELLHVLKVEWRM
ncbi:hypothetical protein P4B35_23170 [Pontiellaceae bacterium B12227]|nr:hypothetical protein [Pontiellaceae bacterium B12227]